MVAVQENRLEDGKRRKAEDGNDGARSTRGRREGRKPSRRTVLASLLGAVLVGLLALPGSALAHAGFSHTSITTESNLRTTYGTVINIHGGGWKAEQNVDRCGQGKARSELVRGSHSSEIEALPGDPAQSRWYADQGWRFVSVGYTAGYPCSIEDAVRWVDRIRGRYGGPICVIGGSAGGHLALLTATRRELDCVMSMGGPVDLNTLCWVCFRPPGRAPDGGVAQDSMYGMTVDERSSWSPIRHARTNRYSYEERNILLGHTTHDWLVPTEQIGRFKAVLPAAQVHYIPPGKCRFPHGLTGLIKASCAEIRDYYGRASVLLRDARS